MFACAQIARDQGTEKTMRETQETQNAIQNELRALETVRDELKLKLHLAKADAKSEWEKLEHTYQRIQEQLQMTRNGAEQPLKEIGASFKTLCSELLNGYARIREQLTNQHN